MVTLNVGANIRRLRERAKLTQAELANILGKDQSAVAAWETGKSVPRVSDLPAISESLGCEITDLLHAERQEVATA